MDWFRWWNGSVTDPKLHMIADETERTRAEIIGIWAILLEHASMNNPRGQINNFSYEVVGFLANTNIETVCNAMQRLAMLHVTDGVLHIENWEKRQPQRERDDNSTERVRAWRERQKLKETQSNTTKHHETPRREKIREDINKEHNGFLLPDWINKEHWEAWHSTAKRKKATAAGKRLAIAKLEKWKDEGKDYAAALEAAAIGGWQGLFEPKDNHAKIVTENDPMRGAI